MKIEMLEPTEEQIMEGAHNYYNMMRSNKSNFSYWYPKVKDCGIKTPKSWWKVLTFDEWNKFSEDCETDFFGVYDFVAKEIYPHIPGEMKYRPIFMKNGTFSDKFDFSLCTPDSTIEDIAFKLSALTMESSAYETDGETEIVIRERWRNSTINRR